MTRRILIVVLLLALGGVVLYYWYGSYGAKRAGASGEVYSNDSSSGRLKAPVGTDSSDTSSSRSASTSTTEAAKPLTYPSAAEQAARGGSTSIGSSTATMPATDSISPNPTNGEVFAGAGKFQLYRQGNITWRLNTDTGQSCILFATDEEWKKPKVLRAGCAGR